MTNTIYVLDSQNCFLSEFTIEDIYGQVPPGVFEAPPSTTGSEVAHWTGVSWEILPSRPPRPEVKVSAEIIAATQKRLDDFARTRNYDGILSACTYASSTVPKFQAEGQYCVEARDATWAKLYGMLAEVQAGTRPAPTGYSDIEGEFPELTWPA